MQRHARLVATILMLVAPPPLLAHGGGLDGHGCHHNRSEGGYQCHHGAFTGRAFASKDAMLAALGSGSPAPLASTSGKEDLPVLVGRVTRVVDGDTVDVVLASGSIRVRLSGVDAPEKSQPVGHQCDRGAH